MIILVTGTNVSVTVRDSDLMQGNKRYYAFSNNGYYDPETGFKPCFKGASERRRLYDGYADEFRALVAEADINFDKMKALYETKMQAPQQPQQQQPQQQQGDGYGLGSQLEQALVRVLAEQSVDKVLEAAKPMLDQHIKEVYGMLPQIHEVKTERGVEKIEGVVHEKFDTVLNLVNADIPVFLTGAAGTGKNVICKQVAKALNLEFYFSNAVTQEYKLTGFIDANGTFHETQFYQAFTKGGLFMLDEMDASIPEVLIILNAAIANRYFDFPTGRVEAHKDFRLIAAGNTFGTGADIEYTGRFQLDAASLDRFALVEIDYSEAIEKAISKNDEQLVEYIHAFRNAVQEAGVKHLATYRSIERITKLKDSMELGIVMKMCLLKSISNDDLRIINRETKNYLNGRNEYLKAAESLLK
jgi:hypothetical protein